MSQTAAPAAGVSHDELAAIFERTFAADEALANRSFAARRVLAAAAALLYRDGGGATSIRDITNACGLSPGALYNHFASKDDLLEVLISYAHDRLERRISRALAETGGDPVQRYEAFVRAYVLGHLEQPQLAQLARREYLNLPDERRVRIVRRRRLMREQLAGLLAEGLRGGRLALVGDDERAATRTAIMVLDMCSRTSEWYDRTRPERPDALAQRYVVAALRLAGAS